jgi:hypothetical protein
MTRRDARPRPAVAAVIASLLIGLGPAAGVAHEERLLVGRVEAIEPARKLLVLVAVQGGERRRLEINPETEVVACRTRAGLAVVQPGALVRVKYLERAGGPFEARSVLLLGNPR